jgi:hypothetical protein
MAIGKWVGNKLHPFTIQEFISLPWNEEDLLVILIDQACQSQRDTARHRF